jgi:hypothetical protein
MAMILTCSVLGATAQAQECGDADGNGQITVTDGVNILRAAAGLSSPCTLARCDVDGSGSITVTDAVNLLRIAAGLSVELACAPQGGFVENGDGTVTDTQTGLQWEKKTTAVGSGANLADPHDVDNTYTWSKHKWTTPNGTAFTEFLPRLNGASSDGMSPTGCLASHCDWRLPSLDELLTISRDIAPSQTSPCIDPAFGPTVETIIGGPTRTPRA